MRLPTEKKTPAVDANVATDEQRIIRASDAYLRNIAEFIVRDLADITGDHAHASPFDGPEPRSQRAALSEMASLRATTLQGLVAKARVVKAILDLDGSVATIEEDEFAFLRDFAEEARDFFARTAVAERKAARVGHAHAVAGGRMSAGL
jgi:hypothetical protein